MFHIVTALVAVIFAARVIYPLPWPRSLRLVLIVVVLLVSQHHLASRLIWGTMFSPEAPRAFMIAVNWVFGTFVIGFGIQLVADLITLLTAAFRRHWRPAPPLVRQGVFATSVLLAGIGVSQAIRVPDVTRIDIAIRDLPFEFEGYQLVQLTDLHLSKLFQREWTEEVVARTNALNADLIVITGDLIDGTINDRESDVRPLGELRAEDGTYVIPGNHEYYFGYPAWMQRFADLGMTVLANSHAIIDRDGAELTLAGVTDRTATGLGFPSPDIGAALEGAPADAPIILLDHQPLLAVTNAAAGVDLQLSGHTHGGMIWGMHRLIARFNEGFVSGHYDVGDMQLYVSNGTALWIGFAMRLGKPSEITLITLHAA